ncbi:MAG: L-2-hydroxyglutarate oxidase [Waddliaceae bacterium]|nr:L-2-hydroxyglutarate oxidase [Waddliaceae bacterium]
MKKIDVLIIGAGIVGLATALRLLEAKPHIKLAIVDKEAQIAAHQSGHNSGVIHQGIYYKPGSLKARNCRKGVEALLKYCDKKEIPYELCGKLIVATSIDEIPRLNNLLERAKANKTPDLKVVDEDGIREIEPYAAGVKGLYSPNTGIIHYPTVAKAYLEDIQEYGGELYLEHKVESILEKNGELIIRTGPREFQARHILNCGGVYCDRIARLSGEKFNPYRIVPFRGEYYDLHPDKRFLLKGLIYPVPDPKFPFLGVHLTRTIHGNVEAGPNAVLALDREGYGKFDISFKDTWETLAYPGFWRLGAKHWVRGCYEVYRSLSKKAFLRALQKLLPSLEENDLIPGGSGIRAQLLSREGHLKDDFEIIQDGSCIHVLNAPSPGATSSLAIGQYISKLASTHWKL